MTADNDSNTSEPLDDYSDEPTGPEGMGEGERVAKALARAGVASRREVERYIEDRRVALNGVVLTTPAVKVSRGDILTVDGKVVDEAEPTRVWRYHKPNGLMTSHNDPQGRPTVFDNLPVGMPRVISVGRLDLNTEGLLLLTNDGELARALELPATGLSRRYRARARGHITQDKLDKLKDGMTVEGVHYGPIEATLDKAKEASFGANLWITLTLAEGKNREVRRVLEALGLTVNRLIRLAYGPFSLGELAAGDVEEVGPRVIREQLADHIAADQMPTGNAVQQFAKASARGGGTPMSRRDPHGKADEPKKVYKEGWATPKIKVRPQTKSGPSKWPDRSVPDKKWTPTPPGGRGSRDGEEAAVKTTWGTASPIARTGPGRRPGASGDKSWTGKPVRAAEGSAPRPTSKYGESRPRPDAPRTDFSRSANSRPGDKPDGFKRPAYDKPRAPNSESSRPPSTFGAAKGPRGPGAGDTKPYAPRSAGSAGDKAGGFKRPYDKPRGAETESPRSSSSFGAAKGPRGSGPGEGRAYTPRPAGGAGDFKKPYDKPRAATSDAPRPPSKFGAGKPPHRPDGGAPRTYAARPAGSGGGDRPGGFNKRPYDKPRPAHASNPMPRNPTPWAPIRPDDAKPDRSSSDKPRAPGSRPGGKPFGSGGSRPKPPRS